MFGELNFWQMLLKGGITVFVLLIISVISWWIIIERAIRFSKIRVDSQEFMDKIRKLLAKKDKEGALSLCQLTPGPLSAVIRAGIKCESKEKEKIENAMQRALNYESIRMQRYLGVLGSIGNVSPFIGLFGTVLGIIRAFKDLALSSGGGPAVVANGIAEALIATAVGLFVAVPAVISYNFFVRTIDNIETEVINASSELLDILAEG